MLDLFLCYFSSYILLYKKLAVVPHTCLLLLLALLFEHSSGSDGDGGGGGGKIRRQVELVVR